jgi:multidrug efflux pump subunit AcrB
VDLAVSGPELEKTQLLADKLAAALRKSGKLTDVSANQDFARRSKVATLEVDSPKAKAQSVSRADIFSTLQVYLGSVIVNDFALFGKTSQVVVPLDSINNKNIDDLMQLKVRNVKGEMVELKALMNVRQSDVSGAINRLDLQPYVQVTANPATDVSTAEGRTLCQRLFDDLRQESRLPGEYRLIWLQEK